MDIFYKKGAKFVIKRSNLSAAANKDQTINALYAAAYVEFLGASKNPAYAGLTPKDRIAALNTFAKNWLQERDLL